MGRKLPTSSSAPDPSASFFGGWTTANVARLDEAPPRATRRPPRRATRPGRTRNAAFAVAATLAAGAAAVVLPGSSASADPSAQDWLRLRTCESSNNYAINTGNGYYGAYQFDVGTWHSVGGSGYPNHAPPAEQDARALILYRTRGWQPWTCAGIVGLVEDSDARSGRTDDISIGAGTAVGTSTGTAVPAFPGPRAFRFGDRTTDIKRFQDQMHRRGFFPVGTGEFGPNTLAMVKQLQRLNAIPTHGLIGRRTWRLAWVGTYSAPTAPTPTPAPTAGTPSRSATSRVPAFPGTRWYVYGDDNRAVKRFQDRMHRRGFFPVGTGEFGPHTLAMVRQLQRLNGLTPNGYLGPNTWRLAWVGRYRPPA